MNPITIREASKIARSLGMTRGHGTINGMPYWVDAQGRNVSLARIAELAGY